MEGGDEDVEADVIKQLNDESIRMKIYQFMEDIFEHDFEHVTNQEPSHVQEIYAPTKHVRNPLPIGIELIQLVQSKLVQLV
jgi:hypothetical protein